ncbi:Gfo/Idh/MocA family oxidoreductase [Agrobacterium genomosp. 3 str. CIP 111-78]|uniref:Inositol 2-dehydrogenase n=1 Tax=Agrobacterium tumefaciens TaxID=358 RepID=A0AAE6EM05_AGRTU|nr:MULTISPECIES: Gfo/Idh/MocA family oxidoreductase [Agrobacterium tumefaciens complex]MCA2370771.1 Gfo/Idh/MocA family oxidoreductase [Agrobacterium tomkonis CIP 111-78]QCM02688.1 Gfo/Idh/MocA family oxidoreductase [Agrobacterium tumefaciens]
MTLKIGVIGTGAIGQEHIERLHNRLVGATVVAVNDINRKQAEAVAKSITPAARVFDSGQALIADPQVDAIVVTSWGPTHEEFVLASIAAGKPVFCEKPLATSAQACLNIVNAEVASGRHLVQVGFMRRYDRSYRLLKQQIDNGNLGAPLMVHCAHRNPSVPDVYAGDMAITDSFVHEIDVLRWLLDDDYVSAQVVLPRKTRHSRKDLDDPHMILLETKKGIRIDVEIFVNCPYGYDIQCQVVGEDGIGYLPEPMSVLLRKEAKLSHEILQDWKLRFIDSYDVELQEWIGSVKAGVVRGPTAWDGYFASATADACVVAKHSGGIVPIEIGNRPDFYDPQPKLSAA